MSNIWLGEESKDLASPSLSKMKKHLMAGKIIELKSIDDAIIRVRQVPPGRANTKAEGFVLSVLLVSSPDSVLAVSVHVASQAFMARTIFDHIAIPTFRRYRFVSSDPLGVETSET